MIRTTSEFLILWDFWFHTHIMELVETAHIIREKINENR